MRLLFLSYTIIKLYKRIKMCKYSKLFFTNIRFFRKFVNFFFRGI